VKEGGVERQQAAVGPGHQRVSDDVRLRVGRHFLHGFEHYLTLGRVLYALQDGIERVPHLAAGVGYCTPTRGFIHAGSEQLKSGQDVALQLLVNGRIIDDLTERVDGTRVLQMEQQGQGESPSLRSRCPDPLDKLRNGLISIALELAEEPVGLRDGERMPT
jgi:hypothetical protein